MSAPVRQVVLRQRATAQVLARGHPWVWRDAVAKGLDAIAAGDEVQVVAPAATGLVGLVGLDGVEIGRGLADPTSPIAVRLWTRHRRPVDRALWRERAEQACAKRRLLFRGTSTDAFRVIHGEGDRMPGLVVDRYGAVAVARADGAATVARMSELADAIWPALSSLGVTTLVHRIGAKGEKAHLDVLRGDMPPSTVQVEEHGVPFVVDVARGQKTGAFLDQRENRRRVGELARGRRVLNLFSYTGGFALHALRGGATHVTNVDIAAAAHANAAASLAEAGIDRAANSFVTSEVRGFLEAARSRGETWDLIVSDPPSFAASERTVARALSAYRALHEACAAVLAPGGIFCASSCSSHVDASAFLRTLDDVALGGRELEILEVRGAGPDHPTLAAFPEGRYLKFVILA